MPELLELQTALERGDWDNLAYARFPMVNFTLIEGLRDLKKLEYELTHALPFSAFELQQVSLIDYLTYNGEIQSHKLLFDYLSYVDTILKLIPDEALPHLEAGYERIKADLTYSIHCLNSRFSQ